MSLWFMQGSSVGVTRSHGMAWFGPGLLLPQGSPTHPHDSYWGTSQQGHWFGITQCWMVALRKQETRTKPSLARQPLPLHCYYCAITNNRVWSDSPGFCVHMVCENVMLLTAIRRWHLVFWRTQHLHRSLSCKLSMTAFSGEYHDLGSFSGR